MAARAFPPKDVASWLTPRQAIAMLDSSGTHLGFWQSALLERLRGDMVSATARDVTYEGSEAAKHPRQTWAMLLPVLWKEVTRTDPMWVTGDLTLKEAKGAYSTLITRCFDVRFDPADIKKMLPAAAQLKPQTRLGKVEADPPTPQIAVASAKNRGGRPSKDWWPDLWVEMCRQIYAGELKHEKQSQIESAMADWISREGHGAGEQTIRRAARKLFAALTKEDQN